ncbi:MAG: hypothetical protein ACKOPQ_14820 [Novosphingobium sp.]
MSTKLALSSALSVMLMATFAVFSGASVNTRAQDAEESILSSQVQMPSVPKLPDLPILR